MPVYQTSLKLHTRGRGMTEITDQVAAAVREAGIETGLCTVFCMHTSASLLVQENADPTVQRDLMEWLGRVAPDGDRHYAHNSEGPDDMAAHLRTAITHTSETIPVGRGRLLLGTWQGIYLLEHRTAPHSRTISITVMGD